MKNRFLLTVLLSVLVTIGYSQTMTNAQSRGLVKREFLKNTKKVEMAPSLIKRGMSTARKSAANGVYYSRPAGSMVTGTTIDGLSYYINTVVVAPFSHVVFENKSTNPSLTSWFINGELDEESVDENGNLDYGYIQSGYPAYYYLPTLAMKDITYNYGEGNEYYAERGPAYMMVDSIDVHAFYDNRVSDSGYGWGALSSGYIFGSGGLTFNDGTQALSLGFVQYCPKPISPLYVESVHCMIRTENADGPIGGNYPLEMAIMSVVVDENGNESLGNDTIAVLKATQETQTKVGGPYAVGDRVESGQVYLYTVEFKQTEIDGFGVEATKPFTVNDKFAVVVTGVSDEGNNIGFECAIENPEDKVHPTAEMILYDGEGAWIQPVYSADLIAELNFNSCFDYCEALDAVVGVDDEGNQHVYNDINILRVSTDGKTVSTEGSTEETDLSGAYIYTAFTWYDNEGFENYSADVPEWVTTVYGEDGSKVLRWVTFECEPLPAGTKGRVAKLYFEGKGYKSELPVILLQGDVTITDAIEGVVSENTKRLNTTVYNIIGQRVNRPQKGIFIQNGKKFIRK